MTYYHLGFVSSNLNSTDAGSYTDSRFYTSDNSFMYYRAKDFLMVKIDGKSYNQTDYLGSRREFDSKT